MRWPWQQSREVKVVAPELDELLEKATYIAEKVDDLVATMHAQLDAVEEKKTRAARDTADGHPQRRTGDNV